MYSIYPVNSNNKNKQCCILFSFYRQSG